MPSTKRLTSKSRAKLWRNVVGVFALATAIPVVATPITVVEYYYNVLDHYFLTAQPGEISFLDSLELAKPGAGWVRTGNSLTED